MAEEPHTPISRVDARARGLIFYFTGKPCRNGHISPRYVSTVMCLACRRMHERNRIKSEPERHRTKARRWYANNAEKARAMAARYKNNNIEKVKRKGLNWRNNNRSYLSSLSKQWRQKNPEKVRLYTAERRARKIGARGMYTIADIERIFRAQDGRCAGCAKRLTAKNRQIDHITPLVRGGTNDPANLQIMCGSCNSSKKERSMTVFMRERGRLL